MEELKIKKRAPSSKQKMKAHGVTANFYGALKSKHELYFQMASLFQQVTKEKKLPALKMMELILRSKHSDNSGKFYLNHI